MKITIKVSKKDLRHLLPTHSFIDCCLPIERIMKKILKEAEKIEKKLK